MEEILEFCFKKFAAVWLFRNFLFSVLPVILLIPSKGTAGLSAVWIPVFFFAVFAAVDFLFFIGQEEDLVKLLLDGSDTARIPAGDDILDLLWKMQFLFLIDLVVLDDVDCDIVIDESQCIQVNFINRALDLDNVLFAHLVALCIFDNGNGTVKFVESQVFIDFHALAGFDVIQYETFVKSTDI